MPHVGFRVKRLTKSRVLGTGVSRVVGSLSISVTFRVSCVMPLISRLPMMMACHRTTLGQSPACCNPTYIERVKIVRNMVIEACHLKVLVFCAVILDRLQPYQHGKREVDGIPWGTVSPTILGGGTCTEAKQRG